MAKVPNVKRRSLERAERDKRILEMRLAGAGLDQIAEAVGVTKGHVRKVIWRWMEKRSEETQALAERIRELELARLDRLLMAVWPQALAGDLQAVDRAVRIIEQRARMLGLNVQSPVLNVETVNVETDAPSVLVVNTLPLEQQKALERAYLAALGVEEDPKDLEAKLRAEFTVETNG